MSYKDKVEELVNAGADNIRKKIVKINLYFQRKITK